MLSKGPTQKDPVSTCKPSSSHDGTGYEKSVGTQFMGENVPDAGDDGPDTELAVDEGDPIWWTGWFIDMSVDIDRGCGFSGIPW